MSGTGLIDACKNSGCGFKCCSFGTGGHIVILPHEFDGHEQEISHLQIIDDDYFGGNKVKCIAKDCRSCDNGYKPIMCRTYPLWVKSVSKGFVFRSSKCPLKNEQLSDHMKFALDIFNNYRKTLLPEIDIDTFLKSAWVDRYEPMFQTQQGSMEYKILIRPLSITDLGNVVLLDQELFKAQEMCFVSEREDVKKCLLSGCSFGLFINENLSAYSLAYFTEYGTAYIEKCFVYPDCRGNGFQSMLLKYNIGKLLENGVHEIFTMTSPCNRASIKSFQNVGFSIKRSTTYKEAERIVMKWEL